jgi:sterol desaturase/sphingolipid hydroxylase (fatty acid hydroxylase superfamily)
VVQDFLFPHEPVVRLGSFASVFTAMALWEALAPRRRRPVRRRLRWPGNLGIIVLNTVLLRIALPVTAVEFARIIHEHGWGLLTLVGLHGWLHVLIGFLALDLVIYLQHVAFHAVPWLWRLHRMHHADLDFDFTTGGRFHTIEIVLSMLIKFAVIALVGAPAVAVLVFEVALNATSMFNHGNAWMPLWLDRRLRWAVVTPDMHRVHHSIVQQETDSNFGFNLPWWDRLFGTYRDQPAAGHDGITIGINAFRTESELRLHRMLIQPFLDAGAPSNVARSCEASSEDRRGEKVEHERI